MFTALLVSVEMCDDRPFMHLRVGTTSHGTWTELAGPCFLANHLIAELHDELSMRLYRAGVDRR